jgi:ATPase family associated with various cellular activities (AAA)/AAA+ lid domain
VNRNDLFVVFDPMSTDFEKFQLLPAVQAGVPLIQIVSFETLRVHALVNEIAKSLRFKWFSWNRVEGLKAWNASRNQFDEADEQFASPSSMLEHYASDEFADNSILILEDFHPDLGESQPLMIRRLRNIALDPPPRRCLILCQPMQLVPEELQKEMQVLELPLPSVDELGSIHKRVCTKFDIAADEPRNRLLEAALGLTIMEAQVAFGKAAVSDKVLGDAQVDFVVKEKEQIIRKSGYLEYFHPSYSLQDVGGLDVLKGWLKKRGRGFDTEAREFGLDTPRGALLLGIPGTGKSLTAKAIAATWRYPLLKLDMGKVYGGIVGQSESNMRNALQVAEAMAPCVLWLDEIEKGMSGMESSGSTDGGTSSRVMGTFLTWLQEKTRPVFVVATANRIGQLPPELLRKGRMDEIFFVDLPSDKARREILAIHLAKKKRKVADFDLDALVAKSKGFSGAELEEAVKEALFQAFDEGHQLTTDDIVNAIGRTTPLSRTRGEEIKQMREWAKSRAVLASSDTPTELPSDEGGKIPKLKSESSSNPFITD